MTIRVSPYECRVLKPMRSVVENDIVDFINRALVEGYCGPTRELRLCLIGESEDTIWNYRYFNNLKGWLHPLPIYNREFPEHIGVFTDMRHYGASDPVKGEYRIRAEAEHRFAKLRSLLQYRWSTEGARWLRDFSDLPCWMYATWIADAVARRFNLDQQEHFRVQAVAGLFYQTLFSESNEWTDNDRVRIPRVLAKVTFGKPQVISDMMDEYQDKLSTIDDLCVAIHGVSPIKLSDFNTGLLVTMLGTSWFNSNVREVLGVSLEHPPTWTAVLFMLAMDRSFNRTILGTLLQRKKKPEIDAFLECLRPLALTNGLSLESHVEKINTKQHYGNLKQKRKSMKIPGVVTPPDRQLAMMEGYLLQLDPKFRAPAEPTNADLRGVFENYSVRDPDLRVYLKACGGLSHSRLSMDYLSAKEIMVEINTTFSDVDISDAFEDEDEWIPFARRFDIYAWVNVINGEIREGYIDAAEDNQDYEEEFFVITHMTSIREYLNYEIVELENLVAKMKSGELSRVHTEAHVETEKPLVSLSDVQIPMVAGISAQLQRGISLVATEFDAWSKSKFVALRRRLRPVQLFRAIVSELRRQDPRYNTLREPDSTVVRDWRYGSRVSNRDLIDLMEINPGLTHPYLQYNYFSAYQSMKLTMELRTFKWKIEGNDYGSSNDWVPFGSGSTGLLLVHVSRDVVLEGLFVRKVTTYVDENNQQIDVVSVEFVVGQKPKSITTLLGFELDRLEVRGQ